MKLDRKEILSALETITIAGEGKNMVESGAVKNVLIFGNEVTVDLLISTPAMHIKKRAEDDIKKLIHEKFSPDAEDKVNIKVETKENPNEINLQPDDYAMMLKGFMKSDIKDWETRKEQLQKILADDLEVLVMLKNDLGIEYFNKQEFSEKLIVPSVALKRMKVIDIQSNEKNEIKFIRIIQE